MNKILTKRTIVIFSIALLLAIISMIFVNVLGSSGPVTGFANTVTKPIRALASSVARVFGNIYYSMYRYEELIKENEELQKQIALMEAEYRDSLEIAEENRQLREVLGFRQREGGHVFEWGTITIDSMGGDNWSSSFVINKGYTDSDIKKGMAVTTETGVLIGQIYDVGPTTSTVITVLDTKFSTAAYVGRSDTGDVDTSSSVVAKGDFKYMGNGMLMLDQIDDSLTVRKGDRVVTSGFGGVIPSGILIGEVQDVIRHESGIGRYAPVKPSAMLDTVTTVFIITGFEETE